MPKLQLPSRSAPNPKRFKGQALLQRIARPEYYHDAAYQAATYGLTPDRARELLASPRERYLEVVRRLPDDESGERLARALGLEDTFRTLRNIRIVRQCTQYRETRERGYALRTWLTNKDGTWQDGWGHFALTTDHVLRLAAARNPAVADFPDALLHHAVHVAAGRDDTPAIAYIARLRPDIRAAFQRINPSNCSSSYRIIWRGVQESYPTFWEHILSEP